MDSKGKGIIQHSFDEAKKAYCQQIILIILNLSHTNAYLTTIIGPQKLKYISYSFEVVSNPSVPADSPLSSKLISEWIDKRLELL